MVAGTAWRAPGDERFPVEGNDPGPPLQCYEAHDDHYQDAYRSVVATVSTMVSVGRIVAESDFIATLPRRVAEIAAATLPVRIHPLPLELWDVRIALGWHERCHDDPGHRFFRDLKVTTVGERKKLDSA